MEQWQILKQKLLSLLACLSSKLKPTDIKNIEALINEGEELIALEILCSQLAEWDSACTPEQIMQIATVGKEIGLDESYLQDIPIE